MRRTGLAFLRTLAILLIAVGVAPLARLQDFGLAEASAPSRSTPQPAATDFDHRHTVWDALLKQRVQKVGEHQTLVDYARLKADPAPLRAYLSSLTGISEATFHTFSRNEQLAFLINAYNAFLVDLVIKKYPLSSIKNVGIPFVGPWKSSFIPLLGKMMSPDDLEHGLLRKTYKESRIHFGVNCASISCPPLRPEAFVADRLDQQLDEQASLFFANTKENRFDAKNQALTLSPILDWFKEDFTSTGPEGTVRYVARYRKDLAEALKKGLNPGAVKVTFGVYDWDLNDTAKLKAP